MLKSVVEYSKEDLKRIYCKNGSIVLYDVLDDRATYMALRSGKSVDIDEHRKLEMTVVELLENLGYDLEETGTYLYKDVIVGVVDYLQLLPDDYKPEDLRELLISLNSPFSQFYFNLARNERDIGTKTFHELISKAHSTMDVRKANRKLVGKLYKGKSKTMNYGEYALFLAEYVKNTLIPALAVGKGKDGMKLVVKR